MKCELFYTLLPATMQWYQLMSQISSVSYAMSQWDKTVLTYQQSIVCGIKYLILPPDNSQSSIKDGTPKKARLQNNLSVIYLASVTPGK